MGRIGHPPGACFLASLDVCFCNHTLPCGQLWYINGLTRLHVQLLKLSPGPGRLLNAAVCVCGGAEAAGGFGSCGEVAGGASGVVGATTWLV